MSLYDSFSPRARRAVFWAHAQAQQDGASEITAGHILHGILKEDPHLFVVLVPTDTNLASELAQSLGTKVKAPVTEARTEALPLSTFSKEIIRVASRERNSFGHKSVGTQHLLLALLICAEKRTTWFRRLTSREISEARQVLAKSGLTASSVKVATKAGIVTPLTWVLDDPIVKFNAQLAAVAELLIVKGIFTRCEFVALLDDNAEPVNRDAFLLPLVNALLEKGKLTQAERDAVSGEQPSKPDNEKKGNAK